MTAIAHSIPAFSSKQIQRFWSAVLKLPSGCWEWQSRLSSKGYGIFHAHGKDWRAHRIAWELTFQRPTPIDLQHDHLCRNPRCVNPERARERASG